MISVGKIISMVSDFIDALGFNGCMIALDNVPPFILKFEVKPEAYQDDFSAEYDYASYPGARHQFPIFKGCSPHVIEFKLRYDLARMSHVGGAVMQKVYDVAFGGAALNINPVELVPPVDRNSEIGKLQSALKGTNTATNLALKLAKVDYISRVRATIEKLKMPKVGLSEIMQNAAGVYLRASQGVGNPAPPLTLLIRSINQFYLGYLESGKITELQYDSMGCCERIEVDCKFLVTPDLVFTSYADFMREANILLSLGDFV